MVVVGGRGRSNSGRVFVCRFFLPSRVQCLAPAPAALRKTTTRKTTMPEAMDVAAGDHAKGHGGQRPSGPGSHLLDVLDLLRLATNVGQWQ